jgi:hypothetical protein
MDHEVSAHARPVTFASDLIQQSAKESAEQDIPDGSLALTMPMPRVRQRAVAAKLTADLRAPHGAGVVFGVLLGMALWLALILFAVRAWS